MTSHTIKFFNTTALCTSAFVASIVLIAPSAGMAACSPGNTATVNGGTISYGGTVNNQVSDDNYDDVIIEVGAGATISTSNTTGTVYLGGSGSELLNEGVVESTNPSNPAVLVDGEDNFIINLPGAEITGNVKFQGISGALVNAADTPELSAILESDEEPSREDLFATFVAGTDTATQATITEDVIVDTNVGTETSIFNFGLVNGNINGTLQTGSTESLFELVNAGEVTGDVEITNDTVSTNVEAINEIYNNGTLNNITLSSDDNFIANFAVDDNLNNFFDLIVGGDDSVEQSQSFLQ